MAAEGRNFALQTPFLLNVQDTRFWVQSLKGYFLEALFVENCPP